MSINQLDPANTKEVIQQVRAKLQKEDLNQEDLQKIWKALFYGQQMTPLNFVAMWHSDKYFNQQLLATDIAQLSRLYYHKFNSYLLYLRAMLFVLQKEWDKIDYWRTNKFLMMFRCILEEIILLVKHFHWKDNYSKQINDVFSATLLQNTDAGSTLFINIYSLIFLLVPVDGLQLHFIQIFIDCLVNSNTSATITDEAVTLLLDPFFQNFQLLKTSPNSLLREKIITYIYEKLLNIQSEQLQQFKIELYAFNVLEIAQNDLNLHPQNRKTLYKKQQPPPQDDVLENEKENQNQDPIDEVNQQVVEEVPLKKKKKEKVHIDNQKEEISLAEKPLQVKKKKISQEVTPINEAIVEDDQILKVQTKKKKAAPQFNHIEDEGHLANGEEVKQNVLQKKKKQPDQQGIINLRSLSQLEIEEDVLNGQKKSKKNEKLLKKQEEMVTNAIIHCDEKSDDLIEGLDYSEVRKSKEKMEFLKQIMNSIPPFLFMSPQEKRKYFGDVSKRFMENIVKESGSRCPHQKKVKFGNDLQVQEFHQTDSVLQIQSQKLKRKTKKVNL